MIDLGDTRLLIVAGKGGVGKTTVAAVAAEWARRAGRRVCLVDIEGRPGLGAFFGHGGVLSYEPMTLADGLTGRSIAPDRALVEYLDDHGLRRFSKRLVQSGALEVIATGAPGLRDILVLGKLKQMALGDSFDLVIVDSPASGHAVSFLLSPRGLLDAVRGGPVRAQAEDVLTLLSDHSRCKAVLVALAEETPINETIETAEALRTRIDIEVAGVVVNQVLGGADLLELSLDGIELPSAERLALNAAAEYTKQRVRDQRVQIGRLGALPAIELPDTAEPLLDPLVRAFSAGMVELAAAIQAEGSR